MQQEKMKERYRGKAKGEKRKAERQKDGRKREREKEQERFSGISGSQTTRNYNIISLGLSKCLLKLVLSYGQQNKKINNQLNKQSLFILIFINYPSDQQCH